MAALVTPDGVKRVLPNAAAVKAFAEERNIDGKLAGNLARFSSAASLEDRPSLVLGHTGSVCATPSEPLLPPP